MYICYPARQTDTKKPGNHISEKLQCGAVRCQVNELKHVKLCNDPLKYLNMKNK